MLLAMHTRRARNTDARCWSQERQVLVHQALVPVGFRLHFFRQGHNSESASFFPSPLFQRSFDEFYLEFRRAHRPSLSISSPPAARRRQALSGGVDEQFNTFVHIAEQYLKPTSPEEVNISWEMQANISLLQDKETFSALDGESRRDVLKRPKKEVVRVLEQNLLAKFEQSQEMLKSGAGTT